MSKDLTISIIIPVHNEAKNIERFIQSILNCSGYNESFEIIFIDDASSDNTLSLLKEWEGNCKNIKVFSHSKQIGPAASRNNGILAAKNSYIAFVDADCIVESSWLEEIQKTINEIQASDVAGAGGWILPLFDHDNIFQRIVARFPMHRPRADCDGNIIDLPSGNVIYKKSVLEDINFFDKTLYFGEDTDLSHKVRQNGYRLIFKKEIKVYHQVPENFTKLSKSQYNYGRSFAGHLKRLGSFTWKPIFGHYFLESLPGYLFLILSLVIVLFSIELFLVILILYVVTALFSLRFFKKIESERISAYLWIIIIHQSIHFFYQLGYLAGGIDAKK